MAMVATAEIPEQHKQELLCTYASLILADEKMEISADNLQKLITASGNTVEPYMPMLFARALQGQNVSDLLCNAGSAAVAAPAASAAAVPAGSAAAGKDAAPAKEEKKEEPEEEEEDDMGFSLFD